MIESLNDWLAVKPGERCEIICTKCGKPFVRKKVCHGSKLFEKHSQRICATCYRKAQVPKNKKLKTVEPVFISDWNEISKLTEKYSTLQPVQFNCIDCGQLVLGNFKNIKHVKKSLRCTGCLCKRTRAQNGKPRHFEKPFSEKPIFIKGYSEFLEIAKVYRCDQKIQYNCECCDKLTTINELRVLKSKTDLLCSVCRVRKTKVKRYGEDFYFGGKHVYQVDDSIFDSSWEVAFYLYHRDHGNKIKRSNLRIPYEFEGVTRYYHPDFELDDQLFEIKGDYFFENGKMINPYDRSGDDRQNAKYQCGLQNNVIFITGEQIKPFIDYAQSKYGNRFELQFRKRQGGKNAS